MAGKISVDAAMRARDVSSAPFPYEQPEDAEPDAVPGPELIKAAQEWHDVGPEQSELGRI